MEFFFIKREEGQLLQEYLTNIKIYKFKLCSFIVLKIGVIGVLR